MEAKEVASYQRSRDVSTQPQDVPAEVGNYSLGYQRGFDQGTAEGRRHALHEVEEFLASLVDDDPYRFTAATLADFRDHFLPR